MNRAIRRHHYARLKNKRKNYWGFGPGEYGRGGMSPRFAGLITNTPCSCSCWMCGNPRRQKWANKEKITMQERIHDERFEYEQLEILIQDSELLK